MTDKIIQLPLKMPAELARQVALLNRPPNPEFSEFPPLEPVHNPTAGDWLRRKRELIKQASREQCHEWLVGLVLGINGVTRDQSSGREAAIWSMCRDLPDLVWCEETMQAMWARTPFLPTPGECRQVLEAHVAPLLREIAAIERIARTPPSKPQTIAPAYVPPPAPEWTRSPTRGSPPAPLLSNFDAAHGRAPGSVSEAVLAVMRKTQAKRAALGATGLGRPSPDPPPSRAQSPEAAD